MLRKPFKPTRLAVVVQVASLLVIRQRRVRHPGRRHHPSQGRGAQVGARTHFALPHEGISR